MKVFIKKVVLRRKCNISHLHIFWMNESCLSLKSCHLGKANYTSSCNEEQNLSSNQVSKTAKNVGNALSYYRELVQKVGRTRNIENEAFLDLLRDILGAVKDEKNSYSVPEVHAEVLSRALDAEQKVVFLEKRMDKMTSLIMLMLGRHILEELHTNHIVGFYLETNENSDDKEPSSTDLELAYAKFFQDSENELASNIKAALSDMEPESIVQLFRVMLEKSSIFERVRRGTLKQQDYTLARMIGFFLYLPLLSSDETKIIDAVHTALLDFNERKESNST